MNIESTGLYQQLKQRADEIPAGPARLLDEFERMRAILQEHGKYIVLTFPEYTPHDHTRHLDHLFVLADRILGTDFYGGLKPSEIAVLAFGLFAHDWGMAVSQAERKVLESGGDSSEFALLAGEPSRARNFIAEQASYGAPKETVWRDYLRRTHGLRSGARLRSYLEPLGTVFADAVAKVAEGHTLDIREVRDYPMALPVFGETVNLGAIAAYIRIIDLLDLGEDRTPYALWKFVSPADPVSKLEWEKHRALSPVAVKQGSVLREVLIGGQTKDPDVFAALADLRSWVDEQFSLSIAQLRAISGNYDLDLDSRATWHVEAVGFEPLAIRFELQRSEILALLSKELYEDDPLAFVRELLQNSVDAIDMRKVSLEPGGLELQGEIAVSINSKPSGLAIDWVDNGIGMNAETLEAYFAKLGVSWYRSKEARRIGAIEPISRFGVGILSCFAVSNQLRVSTRREPSTHPLEVGLSIEIPTRVSHFRIRTQAGLPVGTTIGLEIKASMAAHVSAAAVCEAITRIARFVRHKIKVCVDGRTFEVRSLENTDSLRQDELEADAMIGIAGMRGNAAEKLAQLTTTLLFEIGSKNGEYHGYYSAVVPKHPSRVQKIGFKEWVIDGEHVDLQDFFFQTEQSLFVKGIQTGPVRPRPGSRRLGYSPLGLTTHTDWIGPRVLVNIKHPTHVDFNLARSSAELKSNDWVRQASREIAAKLRAVAFPWPVTTPAESALMLGSCSAFGGAADEGIESLVEEKDIPLLVLCSEGLIWRRFEEFVSCDEFVEAPFDLGYANSGELKGFGKVSGLAGWEGAPALFPTDGLMSKRYPWLRTVLELTPRTLFKQGWKPVRILAVKAPPTEVVPLFCRVWRNDKSTSDGGDLNWRALKGLYGDAPDVLQFPASISHYAAVGSRYWNSGHPKTARIVRVLASLVELLREKRLSADQLRRVNYLRSESFQGYVVASRYSGANLALEVPSQLLKVAQDAGLDAAEDLVPADFFPGTIDRYQNPYHYNLANWTKAGSGLGRPI